MNLLALDQSSKTSGFAIFKNNKLIDYGSFNFSSSKLDIRLTKFYLKIDELIKNYEIDHVIFEDIQLQNDVNDNVKTFKTLSEVIGVLRLKLYNLKIPYDSVLSSIWKSKLQIKGRNRAEQKKSAKDYVKNKYKINPGQDACDAICIGEYYLLNKRDEEKFDWSN